jgi:hypothetical protein
MSSVQNKLLDLEVAPPPGMWDKIAAELDESELEHKFPSKLYGLAIPPPAGAWQKIAMALDATLPAGKVAEKLLSHEVAPPAAVWNKIKTSLDAGMEATVPERRRLSPLLRYAAAAVIVGAMAWGGVRLLNNKPEAIPVANKEEQVAPKIKSAPGIKDEVATVTEPVDNTTPVTTASEEARNDAALEASKKTYARLDINTTSKIKQAANFYFAEPISTGTPRGFSITDDIPVYEPVTKDAGRYIVLMTPEGNIIRMSKKLSNLVCCVSGEEQDAECKDQMKKWRDKMTSSSIIHSPGNFMDILSLVNSLQNDNE